MDAKVMELAGQAEIVKGAVADRAISVIEQYRKGKLHGREVSMILAELFEAANDTVERMVVDAALKANPSLQGTGHLVDRTLQGVVLPPDSGKRNFYSVKFYRSV
jgi:O-phosphoseryl-tRNA(Cys) synthetase